MSLMRAVRVTALVQKRVDTYTVCDSVGYPNAYRAETEGFGRFDS
jgi:hypothetical protein